MLAKVFSFGLNLLEANRITIETDISPGLPGFTIVGLGDTAVKESRERVRTAIKHSGYDFPYERITVNLAPADIKKQGPSFDAAIAVSILIAMGIVPNNACDDTAIIGELSLNGDLKTVHGMLALAICCHEQGFKRIIVPFANYHEANLVKGLTVCPAKSLTQIIDILQNPLTAIATPPLIEEIASANQLDFADVKGQAFVRRALEVAASGHHHVLLIGPPGSGKSMLAKRLCGIMPPLNHRESLEVTRIHSALRHDISFNQLVTTRPFRSPHHSSSAIALVGGGFTPIPGEITLAHHGVLFLDEFPEFTRHTLESLRQPLEDGYVNIARIKKQCHFPARFMLVAAMNPCPCGFKNDSGKICKCSPTVVERYQQRISGPLLDRIDIHAHVPALNAAELTETPAGEDSATIIKRVINARQRQDDRFKDDVIKCNAHMHARAIQQHCRLNKATLHLLNHATKTLGLSARSYERLLKVARTIADLDNSEAINESHVVESISYRSFDALK